jgi:hypothetical protein
MIYLRDERCLMDIFGLSYCTFCVRNFPDCNTLLIWFCVIWVGEVGRTQDDGCPEGGGHGESVRPIQELW